MGQIYESSPYSTLNTTQKVKMNRLKSPTKVQILCHWIKDYILSIKVLDKTQLKKDDLKR